MKRHHLEAAALKKVGAKSKKARKVKRKSSMVLMQFVAGERSFDWSIFGR